jgi:hypothetical protein
MIEPAPGAALAECRRVLERARAEGAVSAGDLALLAGMPDEALDAALRAFAAEHGAAALPVLGALASPAAERALRRTAKRALYRLAQRGVTPPAAGARPVVERRAEHATRAWLSGVDGSGSRAAWIVFEGGYGGATLCSLIVNDTVGIMEVAGGDITKRRLERELAALRASQKLPWVETDPARAVGIVAEALALHRALGTSPPGALARWRRVFDAAAGPGPPAPPAGAGTLLAERSTELFELPEMAGWFLDPETVHSDALDLLQARQSRLVVSDQVKGEREDAIVTRVVERELPEAARARWARRLTEMAFIFGATDRAEQARLAEAAAAGLLDAGQAVGGLPFARMLARRALELAGEVAVGRISAAEVSRKPAAGGAPDAESDPAPAAFPPSPSRLG